MNNLSQSSRGSKVKRRKKKRSPEIAEVTRSTLDTEIVESRSQNSPVELRVSHDQSRDARIVLCNQAHDASVLSPDQSRDCTIVSPDQPHDTGPSSLLAAVDRMDAVSEERETQSSKLPSN